MDDLMSNLFGDFAKRFVLCGLCAGHNLLSVL